MLPYMGSISFWLAIPVFILGLAVGSFINVVVMRTLKGEDFIKGRSRCDNCKRVLAWYEMIPLLSFLVLRGQCRTCHQEIDIMHPLVELMVGVLFAWWWLIGFAFFQLTANLSLQIVQPIFWLLMGLLLLLITLIDLLSFYIPNWTIHGVFWLVFGYRLFLMLHGWYQPTDFAWSLLGALLLLLFFLFLWLITKGKGFGFGDVKLIFPLALVMGFPTMFMGVWLAFVIGATVGLLMMVIGQKTMKQALPFGPFLVAGTFLSLLYGDTLLSWYMSLL